MKIGSWRITPTKSLGIWSLGLIILMPVLISIGMSFAGTIYAGAPAGGTILKDIAARPALSLTILAGMGSGIAAFITGLLAIIRQGERAVLVYLATLIGGLFMLYLAAEFISPH